MMLHRSETAGLVAARALWCLVRDQGNKGRALDPQYKKFSALVGGFGSPADALSQWGEFSSSEGPDLFAHDAVDDALREAANEIQAWLDAEYHVLALGASDYPIQLADVVDAPPLLFVEGDATVLSLPSVAVVGTRKASEEGVQRAFRAAHALAEAGIMVVSGMAIGIDTAAHQGALAARGKTLAVMGTSIDRRYPAENAPLATRIVAEGGALVSEFSPGSPTRPWHFLRRNRTMSGIAEATLVVEASETSGARSQALAALEHGRPVILPASLVSAHKWARELVETGRHGLRAVMVRTPEQVVEVLRGTVDSPAAATF
jgi:DNA processing protein